MDDREVELRYVADRDEAQFVVKHTTRHLSRETFDPQRPVAYYRTLYLDSQGERYLRSFDGETASRLRVRQYAYAADLGAPPQIASGAFLELKCSSGARRTKDRVELDVEALNAALHGRSTACVEHRLSSITAFASIAQELHAGVLSPRLLTWYRRLCFSGDAVRLTFDEAIAHCRPEPALPRGAPAEPGEVGAVEARAVLEVKLRGSMPLWLERLLGALRPLPDYSKFRSGVAALREAPWRASATVPLPRLR